MFSSPACAEDYMDKLPDITMLLDLISKACTAELLVLSVSVHMHMLTTKCRETNQPTSCTEKGKL